MARSRWLPARSPTLTALAATAVAVAATVCLPHGVRAQSIRGWVVEAATFGPIANAEVVVSDGEQQLARARTDSTGAFVVRLPRAGRFWISGTSLGFEVGDSSQVEVTDVQEQVEVILQLSPTPLEIEGLTIVGRGLELRHRANLPGFRERHKSALPVGNVRLLSSDDPEFRNAGNVDGVLEWFPTERGQCTVVYLDGVHQRGLDVRAVATESLAGVEYYISQQDAPIELRDGGWPCLRSLDWSVLALWRRPGGSLR